MKPNIGNDWDLVLKDYFVREDFIKLTRFLERAYQTQTIYPAADEVFTALKLTPYSNVKVVIFGQDPYHGPNQAHGLAFSVDKQAKIPPSLRNIYKELVDDLGVSIPSQGNLSNWAKQGVLLLNTVLTVEAGQANSHHNLGWEGLTEEIIRQLNLHSEPIVFILWGASARRFKKLIDLQKHATIEAPHPSPLSAYRGFFGSKPFSQANQQLIAWGREPIDWEVT